MSSTSHKGLGAYLPEHKPYADKYPLSAVLPAVAAVERVLRPSFAYRVRYDQGAEGACVGFSCSWMMSLYNHRYYDARWLYKQAQQVDPWPGSDYEGTALDAGLQVLRAKGHKTAYALRRNAVRRGDGISSYHWALTVDEIRAALGASLPTVVAFNWHENFDDPKRKNGEWWIGEGNLGAVRGRHAICCCGASDSRQAFKLVNSWSLDYPVVWLPYATLEQRLLPHAGEAAVATDRL